MNARKLTLTFLILAGIAASSGGADPIKSLSQKLKRDIKAKECPLLAILNFPYSLGRISTGSTLVSERLLTYLAQENAPLVERRLIQSILEERKMWDTGVIDPGSIKSMGRLLGVDAVVIGTLADSPDKDTTEVTARIVRVDTGEILSAGTIMTGREWLDVPKPPKDAQGRSPVPGAFSTEGLSAVVSTPDDSPRRGSPWTDDRDAAIEIRSDSQAMVSRWNERRPAGNSSPAKLNKTNLALDGRKTIYAGKPLTRRLPYRLVAVPVLAPTYTLKTEGGRDDQ